MIVAYNKEHVGDVLLVQLTTEDVVTPEVERVGDVALIKEKTTGEVKGFNLFNASKYVELNVNGNVEVTEELVQKIRSCIK